MCDEPSSLVFRSSQRRCQLLHAKTHPALHRAQRHRSRSRDLATRHPEKYAISIACRCSPGSADERLAHAPASSAHSVARSGPSVTYVASTQYVLSVRCRLPRRRMTSIDVCRAIVSSNPAHRSRATGRTARSRSTASRTHPARRPPPTVRRRGSVTQGCTPRRDARRTRRGASSDRARVGAGRHVVMSLSGGAVVNHGADFDGSRSSCWTRFQHALPARQTGSARSGRIQVG